MITTRLRVLFFYTLSLAAISIASESAPAVQQFWNTDNVQLTWTDANWGAISAGPFTNSWGNGNDAVFTVSSQLLGATADFSSITVDPNFLLVTVTAAAGTTMGTGGTVAPITVGTDSILEFTTGQMWSTAAGTGFIKNGDGIFKMRGSAYTGGFTLNAGTVVIANAATFGSGALNINGGAITSVAALTPSVTSINIGGNFTIGTATSGVTSGDGLATANIATPAAATIDLMNGARKITVSGSALYTLAGVMSNGGIEIAAETPATTTVTLSSGVLLNNGGSTYAGGTTITSGTLKIGASSTPTSGTVTSGPLGTGPVTIKTGGKLSVSGVTNVGYTIGNAIVTDGDAILESPSSGRTLTLTGPLTSTNNTDTIALGLVNATARIDGDISGYHGSFLIDSTNTNTLSFNTPGVAGVCLTDGSNAKFVLSGGTTVDATTGTTAASKFLRFGDTVAANTVATMKMGELSGTGGEINANVAHATINIEAGYLNTDASFAGQWAGRATQTANFIKVGTGSLTLSGLSSYGGLSGGTTTISGGTLIAGGDVTSTNVNGVVLTATAGSDLLTFNNHGLVDGDSFTIPSNAGGLLARNRYFVVNSTTNDFQVSTTPGGSVFDITTDASPTGFAASPFGSANTAIVMGNGATGSSNVSLLTGGAFKMARPINVTANGSGVATLGSEFDGNSIFSGAISLAKNVNLTSAATGGNTVNFSGAISGSGFGVTKVGAGSATLSGANTYSGDTTVQQGTLSITNAFLANTAAVRLTTGAILDLNFVGTDSINALFIDAVSQALGVWGATGSGAAHESSLLTGTGFLLVTPAGLSGDYNADGKVDAADYVVWRKNPGAFGGDPAGYNTWRQNFGNPPGSGSSLGGPAAVPEPATAGLILSIVLGAFGGRWTRFNRAT